MVSSATSTIPAQRAASTRARPLVVVDQRAGRVVEVGDDVGHPGCRVTQHVRRQAARSQPARPSRHRRPGPAGRRSPGTAAARWRSWATRRRPARRGRTGSRAAAAIAPIAPVVTMICSGMVGTPRAVKRSATASRSAGSPGRVVAVGGGVARQVGQRALHGAGQPGLRGGQRGAAQVDDGAGGFRRQRFEAAGRQRVAVRHRGPTARAAAGPGESLGAQRVVGGGHRGAADAEGDGQFAFGGQPGGDRDPAFEHQQPDPFGQSLVGRQPPGVGDGRRGVRGEQACQVGGADRGGPLSHGDQSIPIHVSRIGPGIGLHHPPQWHVPSQRTRG